MNDCSKQKKDQKDATPRSTPRSTKSCQIAPAPTQQDKQDLVHLIPGLYLTNNQPGKANKAIKMLATNISTSPPRETRTDPRLVLDNDRPGLLMIFRMMEQAMVQAAVLHLWKSKSFRCSNFVCQLQHCWLRIQFPLRMYKVPTSMYNIST